MIILFYLLITSQILLQQLPAAERRIWRCIDYHPNTTNETTKKES